jgi:hypothetical protein
VPSGGTTGQVLKKNSNTDYDTAWVNESGGSVADGSITTAKLDANAFGASCTVRSNIFVNGTAVNPGANAMGAVDCSAGEKLMGGGCLTGVQNLVLVQNYPIDADTWGCNYANLTGATETPILTAYGICCAK